MTTRSEEKDLIRLLHGELDRDTAARLRQRIADEPDLDARFRRLSETWDRLEPPASSPAPDLAEEVLARVRREGESLGWQSAPVWARFAAGIALPLGLILGLIAAPAAPGPTETRSSSDPWRSVYEETRDEGLTDAYYELVLQGGEEEGISS
ncbi:MAG: hypothetical protein R3234_05285 [Thermoanaerobaculia bacterium]|nr:hypothetical protein [Thermoanaerobaculia bacterium]